MKRKGFISNLLYGIAGVGLGVALVFSDGASILSFITKLIGIFLLVANVPRVIFVFSRLRKGSGYGIGITEFVLSVAGTIMGAVIFLLPVAAVAVASILAGVWFVLLPVLDVASSKYRSEQFKAELPKIILGLLLVVVGPAVVFFALVKVIGGVIILVSVVNFAMYFSRASK